jgi:single-strand DNA-binding protein
MDIITTLTGNLGGEVESRVTKTGQPIACFTVATTPRYLRGADWKAAPTTWTRVECFRQLAENVIASLRKGDPVIVHGRLRTSTWQDPSGAQRHREVLEAIAIGHDLTWGTSSFRKPPRRDGRDDQAGPALRSVPDSWARPNGAESYAPAPVAYPQEGYPQAGPAYPADPSLAACYDLDVAEADPPPGEEAELAA